jgi:hypothetical protein
VPRELRGRRRFWHFAVARSSDWHAQSDHVRFQSRPTPAPSWCERDGAVVAKVKTDGKGRFEVRLGPGQYVLESESAGLPLLKPVDVIVDAHEFTDVELAFDSGIR